MTKCHGGVAEYGQMDNSVPFVTSRPVAKHWYALQILIVLCSRLVVCAGTRNLFLADLPRTYRKHSKVFYRLKVSPLNSLRIGMIFFILHYRRDVPVNMKGKQQGS